MAIAHPTASLIIIGNEILSGRTQDKNTAYIGKELSATGVRLAEMRVIPDEEAVIIAVVNALRVQHDYVFTTGGIGPTHDDITAASIAKAFGVTLTEHPEALQRLEEYYSHREDDLNEARRRMGNIPEGARLIDNPISAAPGFCMENVYVMAGVPVIMQAMFAQIKQEITGGDPILSRSVSASISEGSIAGGLTMLQEQYKEVEIGSYPYVKDGVLCTDIVLRGTDIQVLDNIAKKVEALAVAEGGAIIEERTV